MRFYQFLAILITFTALFNVGVSSAVYVNESPWAQSVGEDKLQDFVRTNNLEDKPHMFGFDAFETPNITEPWKMKCSYQLLQMVDNSTIPEGLSIEEIQAQLIAQQLYIPANQTFYGGLASDEDLVFLEIQVDPLTGFQNITPYLWKVVDQSSDFGILTAYVPVRNIQPLAVCNEVLSLKFVVPAVTNIGSRMTQGDSILHATEVRSNTPFRGEGIRVGVISDSVDHLAEAQATGDLPYNVHVLRNAAPGSHTDEGIAMLEIIHDIAPGAELYFHDGGGSSTGFITALDALSNAGCNIICDDLGYYDQPYFEDGTIATRIKTILRSKDIVFISAAGNDARNHYQGFFYDQGNGLHDFSHGGDPTYKGLYIYLAPGGSARVCLEWNDKWGASNNDYNLVLFDASTDRRIVDSKNIQNGNGDPIEKCVFYNGGSEPVDIKVVVWKAESAQPKTLEVYILPGPYSFVSDFNIIPSDSIFGHHAVNEVVAVGAIDSQDSGHDTIELYSSQGPVTIYYPSTESRKKPDICGIDNVDVTGAGGFGSPFHGTSASAPHIAGIAALVWSADPALSGSQIRSALLSSADDVSTSGWDPVYGYGRANAQNMLSLVYSPTPTPTTVTPTQTTTIPTTIPTTTVTPTVTVSPTDTLPPLQADFTASLTSGQAPLTVQFQDSSQGDPTGWIWDVNGDGFRDYSEKIVEHTYTSPGLYSVTLTVSRYQEKDAVTKSDYVFVTSATPTTSIPTTSIPTTTHTTLPTTSPTPTVSPTSTPAGDMTLNLNPGWNFISVPKRLEAGHNTAGALFSGVDTGMRSIYVYDAENERWRTLTESDVVRPLDGIWIYSENPDQIPLTFKGVGIELPPTKMLYPGWNAIGFSDTTPESARLTLLSVDAPPMKVWSQLIGFNSASQSYDSATFNADPSYNTLMQPTRGYWIYMNGQNPPWELAAISG